MDYADRMRSPAIVLLTCGLAACHAPAPAPAPAPQLTIEPAPALAVSEPPAPAGTAPTPLEPPPAAKWSQDHTLRQGRIVVAGRLPVAVIQQTVRQNYGAIGLCVDTAPPRALTRMTATFTIDASGGIADGMTTKTEPEDSELSACVQQRIRNLVFPKPASGTVSVIYPLVATREAASKPPHQKKSSNGDSLGESFEAGGLGARPR